MLASRSHQAAHHAATRLWPCFDLPSSRHKPPRGHEHRQKNKYRHPSVELMQIAPNHCQKGHVRTPLISSGGALRRDGGGYPTFPVSISLPFSLIPTHCRGAILEALSCSYIGRLPFRPCLTFPCGPLFPTDLTKQNIATSLWDVNKKKIKIILLLYWSFGEGRT